MAQEGDAETPPVAPAAENAAPSAAAVRTSSAPARIGILKLVAEAALVWSMEAVVGLAPLGAHYFMRTISAMPGSPAICINGIKDCHLVSDQPYAEICILAVVLAGTSVIGAFGIGHHFRRSGLTRLSYLMIFLSGTACLAAFGMYAVTTVGMLNEKWARATWWVLAGALGTSFALNMDKAAREPPGEPPGRPE